MAVNVFIRDMQWYINKCVEFSNACCRMLLKLIVLAVLVHQIKCNFICADGKEISKDKICDGTSDCSDVSDEVKELCIHVQCKKNHFRCRYGGCILKSLRCDGKPDCIDGSDEHACGITHHCNYNEFQCLNNNCISINLTCNNHNDCGDNSDEDITMCEQPACDVHKFRCRSGGCIDNSRICDGFLDCFDGSDEGKYTYTLKCPAIVSNSLYLTCYDPLMRQQLCGVDQAVGTVVHAVCKEHYEPSGNLQSSKSYCQFDGRWNSQLMKCKPICGINEHMQPLIANGYPVQNWPWQAGLYSSETGDFKFFCGGTLISENIVITAAHCTWKKSSKQIQAVFAKYNVNLDKYERHTQKRNISKIIIHPNYYDIETNYGSDISILFLESPLTLTQFIRPACMDWIFKIPHKTNMIGMVVGMGITENNTYSDKLYGTELPIVTTEECIKNQRRDFHKYITYTTFCAGWMNGTGVCNGDSGGGLLIYEENRWYLYGIVSISPRKKGMAICDTKRYTIFTKVAMYLDWIKEVVSSTMLGL